MLKINLLTIVILFSISVSLNAVADQRIMDETVEFSKNAIPEKRKAYIAKVIQVDGTDAKKFWKIYASYTKELSKITDQSYDLLDQYAREYRNNNMTDRLASGLMKKHFKLKTLKNKITKKYLKEMSRSFSEKFAMRFLQAEEKMDTVIQYTYQFDIPLVEFK